ncbi:hypothetical protein Q31b_04530 [Novipirellula aureliae]|uniref:VWFA domain-containing protein n=1 Tax=Novipirellula aureliae TaxID=2527966 RepID=A0A5C6E8J0_9BACT|nr:hypothetical protein [Novipirellula aureliae]TWU45282.1 hypothetical protein Q31b_04530 [Novipirellula aureliae]
MRADSSSNPRSPNTRSTNTRSASDWQAIREERNRLERELIRVQGEAKVAELNAKAAELELQIECLTSQLEGAVSREPVIHRFASWQQLADVYEIDFLPSPHAVSEVETSLEPIEPKVESKSVAEEKVLRVDAGHAAVRAPVLHWKPEADKSAVSETDCPLEAPALEAPALEAAALDVAALEVTESPNDEVAPSKRRPLSLILSFLVHAVILFLFAMVTFSSTRPRDQVALSASTVSESSAEMETFSIESIEPVVEPSESFEPTESLVEEELNPIGDPVVTPPPISAVPAPTASIATMMQSHSNSASSLRMKRSNSDARMEFCGVDGGGNHFVYLVDSSGSMGSAFESARMELIRSIHQLKPHQRFYVIFYDSKPDFMRLSDPNQDEQRSVLATPQNKAAMQAWAMRITPDRGKNPNELLEFALDLRPDAIFLLSDGEFPQTTEDLLREKNRRQNLFGDGGIISIVHTIAYHSREGESRMQRIAEQNGGQYRYIPRPKP